MWRDERPLVEDIDETVDVTCECSAEHPPEVGLEDALGPAGRDDEVEPYRTVSIVDRIVEHRLLSALDERDARALDRVSRKLLASFEPSGD